MSSASKQLARRIMDEVGRVLDRIAGLERPEDRFAALLAVINRVLEESGAGRVVAVGGFALELLTGGAMRTLDVDFVVEGYEAFNALEEALRLLSAATGERSARGPVLSLRGVEKALDLLGSHYKPEFPPLRVDVPGFGWFYLEAPEQLLLRYLREWSYWGTREARARVLLLLGVLGDRMDLENVERVASREDRRLVEKLGEAVRLLRRRGLLR